jgi:ketosteroid isomerase-like protein
MLQEKVEAMRRFARAFNEGDVDAMVAELDPNVEWEEQPIPGVDPVYHGHEGFRRWAEAIMGRGWPRCKSTSKDSPRRAMQ